MQESLKDFRLNMFLQFLIINMLLHIYFYYVNFKLISVTLNFYRIFVTVNLEIEGGIFLHYNFDDVSDNIIFKIKRNMFFSLLLRNITFIRYPHTITSYTFLLMSALKIGKFLDNFLF